MTAVLETPLVSIAFGAIVGASLLLLMKRASRMLTPEEPLIGMARVLATVLVELIAAATILTLYFFFARNALSYFGVSMVGAFLILAFVELVRFSGVTAAFGRRR